MYMDGPFADVLQVAEVLEILGGVAIAAAGRGAVGGLIVFVFFRHVVRQTRRGGDKETRRCGLNASLRVSPSPCLLVLIPSVYGLPSVRVVR